MLLRRRTCELLLFATEPPRGRPAREARAGESEGIGAPTGARSASEAGTASSRDEVQPLASDELLIRVLRDNDLAAAVRTDNDLHAAATAQVIGGRLSDDRRSGTRKRAGQVTAIAVADDARTQYRANNSTQNARHAGVRRHQAVAISNRDWANPDDCDSFSGTWPQRFGTPIGIRRSRLGGAASKDGAAKEKQEETLDHVGLNERRANMPTGMRPVGRKGDVRLYNRKGRCV
ncbi:protein of unknown function (plasmid) [Cupriavidus taiwanensis]|uniref:Uncharacterized protein n=1 Tax=Cupriavidus taiwanensis TaxID=164546 RepID=A0A375IVN0_9BURK|nr:protein of unknown function [Cupriavidus taiwanensis]